MPYCPTSLSPLKLGEHPVIICPLWSGEGAYKHLNEGTSDCKTYCSLWRITHISYPYYKFYPIQQTCCVLLGVAGGWATFSVLKAVSTYVHQAEGG